LRFCGGRCCFTAARAEGFGSDFFGSGIGSSSGISSNDAGKVDAGTTAGLGLIKGSIFDQSVVPWTEY